MSCFKGSGGCYARVFRRPAAEHDGCGVEAREGQDEDITIEITLAGLARGIPDIKWRAPPCMRWRGPARFRHADLPIARPLTLLNRPPGPETHRNSRFPGPSCVAGVSPGRSPFPATREFVRLPSGQHKRLGPAISRNFLIHTSIHISPAVIPRRERFSTGPSTVLSTAS